MRLLKGFAIAWLLLVGTHVHAAVVFNFTDFTSCAGLQINGNAACTGGVLRVTPAAPSQAGSAFSTTLIPLGAGASFSTFFSFRISNSVGGGADGIVFVVQPVASTVGGAGGGIGYSGIPTSIGVEIDTWDNGIGAGDPNDSHVGIDLNGSVNSVQTATISPPLDNGNIWYAWIDYNGTTLEVRLSQVNARPLNPTLSQALNLAAILGQTTAFVGFTSGTGAAWADHDILTWRFDDTFAPIGATGPVFVPTLSDTALVLLACLIAGYALYRRRQLRLPR